MNRQLALWRGVALLAIGLGIAFVGYQMTLPTTPDYGAQIAVTPGAPGTVTVTGVQSGSSAARAGIKIGDRVFYGDTQVERARVLYAVPGSRVPVIVNGKRTVMLTAPPAQFSNGLWTPFAIRLAFLFVAAL